jgi:hypothetical protein
MIIIELPEGIETTEEVDHGASLDIAVAEP